jgi:predicted metal-dependent enzyme (double-stranded beta helix superfamily)
MLCGEMAKSLTELCVAAGRGQNEVVGERLRQLVAAGDIVDFERLRSVPHGYSRNLIAEQFGVSVWAIVWSRGAATPIHDHHCSCAFAIARGSLREARFGVAPCGALSTIQSLIRRPGFVATMVPSAPNIHQMVNDGAEEAISLHVYGYSPSRHASSVARVYEPA